MLFRTTNKPDSLVKRAYDFEALRRRTKAPSAIRPLPSRNIEAGSGVTPPWCFLLQTADTSAWPVEWPLTEIRESTPAMLLTCIGTVPAELAVVPILKVGTAEVSDTVTTPSWVNLHGEGDVGYAVCPNRTGHKCK